MEVPSYEFDLLIEKNARKKYACPICHEVIIYTMRTDCNHRFCKYCITKWKMYFKDCPVCRQKIETVAPHPRTDKWIQQLFDLATAEYKQDREMCINYRKLQQTKMDLLGESGMSTQNMNRDKILAEFQAPKTAKTDERVPTGSSKGKSGEAVIEEKISDTKVKPKSGGDDVVDMKMKTDFIKSFTKSTSYSPHVKPTYAQFGDFFAKSKDNEITKLFGTPATLDDRRDSSRQNLDFKPDDDLGGHDASITEDMFPKGINSAHTYSLHYPQHSNKNYLFSMAEVTCHDDVSKGRRHQEDSPVKSHSDHHDLTNIFPEGRGDQAFVKSSEKGHGKYDFDQEVFPSMKEESMRARLQQEITESFPVKKGRHHHRRSGDGQGKQNFQQDKQDLQSCREALLNLRLRLLPPATKRAHSYKDKGAISSEKGNLMNLAVSRLINSHMHNSQAPSPESRRD